VLSQAPAHAHDITNPKHAARSYHASASESMSMSWGRRAAAAALDIGRRFKGRKTSSSSSSASMFPSYSHLAASAPAPATGPAAASLNVGRATAGIAKSSDVDSSGTARVVGQEEHSGRSEARDIGKQSAVDGDRGLADTGVLAARRPRRE
jgi:hypothetical protein